MNRWLCFLVAVLCLAAHSARAERFVLRRDGWSFDRSELSWHGDVTPEAMKAKGSLTNVSGWTEYDFDLPADGWYELWLKGLPAGWTRTVTLDGQPLFWHSVSFEEDEDKLFKGFKEANLWMTGGKHTIRFHRVTWPGTLPSYWELRAAEGDPAGSIRVTKVPHNIVRAGEKIPILLSGGTKTPTRYELVVRDCQTGELIPAGTVEFPATGKPVEQPATLVFAREGLFALQARVDGKLLRPADLKAGAFVAVETKNPPPPAEKLVTKTVVDIDCAANPPATGFWEKDGKTRVVEKPFGHYRESSGLGQDGDGYWGLDGFSYRFELPEAQRLYRIRVDYPDDDRRTMGFWVNDRPQTASSNGTGIVNTGGVETGDQYPLTQKMLTHEAFFYPRGTKDAVVAVINLVPHLKAAASRIRIDLVESGLPAAPRGVARGRAMGFYFEENGRWLKFFGGEKGGVSEDLKTFNRWGEWNRYLGANLMFPTINVYQGNNYPSRILDGYFSTPLNETRLGALVAEKYGNEFVPEFHLSGQPWFDRHVMGVWTEDRGEAGKKTTEVKFASPEAEETVLRDRDGNFKLSWKPFTYNALHPRVQAMYISILGELADSLADCDSFAGISSRMMFRWQWQGWNALPGLNWGYDDWTVACFEKETGLKVPGKPGDPARFRERFNYLTGPQKERWVGWRCAKVFDYHRRLLARIQQARPSARLFFNWFGLDPRTAQSSDMLEQMREVGMDWKLYAKEKNIVIIPSGGTYGRRFSTPLADAGKLDSDYDPSISAAGRFGGRAYGIYSDYFEVNRNLDWRKFGGTPGSAFDANLPSGLNERGMYARALADCDTGFFSNGGSGWIFGTPEILQPFLREYKALPAVPFEPWEKARDPVAVWQSVDKDGTLWFYAVNRLPVTVRCSLGVKGGVVFSAPGGETEKVEHGSLDLALEPFMLRSFRAVPGTKLETARVEVPAAYLRKLEPLMAFARDMREKLASRRILPEITRPDLDAAVVCFDGALAAFEKKEFWKARGLLERLAAVNIYDAIGEYPPGLWERSQPHGIPERLKSPPGATVALGAARGRLDAVADLAYDENGRLWASSGDKLIQLDPTGDYRKTLPLFVPYAFDSGDIRYANLLPPTALEATHVRTLPGGRLLVQRGSSPPILYDGESGHPVLPPNKTFALPGLPVELLEVNARGEAVISCGLQNQQGTSLYTADGALIRKLSGQEARGAAFDKNGRLYLALPDGIALYSSDGEPTGTLEGAGLSRLAVSPDGMTLLALEEKTGSIRCYSRDENGRLAAHWTQPMPARVSAMALSPGNLLAVGFRSGTEGAVARLYAFDSDGLIAQKDLVEGTQTVETKSLDGYTQLKARDGKLYYGAYGKLMRLTPGEPDKVEVAFDPGFRKDRNQFESFAFAPDGDLYLSSNWNGSPRGIYLYRCRKSGAGWGSPEPLNHGKALFEGASSIATDLETDAKGNLLLRLKGEGPKADSDLALYRLPPDGRPEPLLDLHGSARGGYGLHAMADGGLLVAGGTSWKIARLSPEGKVVWMTERLKSCPPGYTDLRCPLGIASDSQGSLWVTDPSRHEILRLDARGRLLGAFGSFGTEDDTAGVFLNTPAGIAAVKDATGREWIYVADVGNRRLIKWPSAK